MPRRDAARMSYYALIRCFRDRLDRHVRAGVTTLAAIAVAGFGMSMPPEQPQTFLVHSRCGVHDWLVVADRQRDRISAYDARDGRPLDDVDRTSGLAEVDALLAEGCWLVVLGDDAPQAMHLPELRPRSLTTALQGDKLAP